MILPLQERCPRCGTALCDTTIGPVVCPRCELAGTLGEDADQPFSGKLGDYDLDSLIAHGGMGAVYLAHHRDTGQEVALKTLLAGRLANAEMRERFLREARLVTKLRHPHIVPLLEVGQADGLPYIALEFVPGKTLADAVRDGPLLPRRAATLLLKITQAVEHAHEQGVLHRDIKPGNVLIDGADEPHVTDFGLARPMDDLATELTVTGQILGSPNYLAPERVPQSQEAGARDADFAATASDVYSLGATFYHLLTGRPPFQGATLGEVLIQVVRAEPIAPRKLNPSVPAALETICLKCLEKDPRGRYDSAEELAADLGRWLEGNEIEARPTGRAAKFWRWCRRNPEISTAGAVAVVVAVLGFSGVLWQWRAARRAQANEQRMRLQAEAAEGVTQRQLYSALLEQARATVQSGELGQRIRTLDAIRRAAAITNTAELRREALAALALPDLRFERQVTIGPDVTFVQFDPTFERIAVGHGSGPVEIRAAPDQQLIATLTASTNLEAYAAKWSFDGRFLAVHRNRHTVIKLTETEVWNVATGRRLMLLHDAAEGALAFNPHEQRLLAARGGAQAAIWDLQTGAEVRRFDLPDNPVHLRLAPDGKRFAADYHSLTNDLIVVYDAETGKARCSTHLSELVRDMDWDPRGRWIAFADVRGDVQLTDPETGHVQTLGRHELEALTAIFSPDGDFLFSGGEEQEHTCWDLRLKQRAFTVGLESSRLQFRGDGHECAITTPEAVRRFSFERPTGLRELNAESVERLHRGIFSRDGRWLVVSGRDRLGFWDWASNSLPSLTTSGKSATPFFGPDGSELFAYWNNGLGRWHLNHDTNAAAGLKLDPLPVYKPRRLYSSFLYSNELVLTGKGPATGGGVEFVALTNVATGPGRFYDTSSGFGTASPDGRWLVLRSEWASWLDVYHLPGMELLKQTVAGAEVMNFAVAPRGDELAVATRAGVEFYAPGTWQRTRMIPMPMDRYANLLFAPDGRSLWVARNSRGAALYDLRTLEEVLPLPAGTLPLALSPDGRNLAVSVDARRLQVWDLVELRRQFRELGVDWEERRSPNGEARLRMTNAE